MPRLVLVHDSVGDDNLARLLVKDDQVVLLAINTYLATLDAARGELALVAIAAEDFILLGNETFGADGHHALVANKAKVVPLFVFVLQLALT